MFLFLSIYLVTTASLFADRVLQRGYYDELFDNKNHGSFLLLSTSRHSFMSETGLFPTKDRLFLTALFWLITSILHLLLILSDDSEAMEAMGGRAKQQRMVWIHGIFLGNIISACVGCSSSVSDVKSSSRSSGRLQRFLILLQQQQQQKQHGSGAIATHENQRIWQQHRPGVVVIVVPLWMKKAVDAFSWAVWIALPLDWLLFHVVVGYPNSSGRSSNPHMEFSALTAYLGLLLTPTVNRHLRSLACYQRCCSTCSSNKNKTSRWYRLARWRCASLGRSLFCNGRGGWLCRRFCGSATPSAVSSSSTSETATHTSTTTTTTSRFLFSPPAEEHLWWAWTNFQLVVWVVLLSQRDDGVANKTLKLKPNGSDNDEEECLQDHEEEANDYDTAELLDHPRENNNEDDENEHSLWAWALWRARVSGDQLDRLTAQDLLSLLPWGTAHRLTDVVQERLVQRYPRRHDSRHDPEQELPQRRPRRYDASTKQEAHEEPTNSDYNSNDLHSALAQHDSLYYRNNNNMGKANWEACTTATDTTLPSSSTTTMQEQAQTLMQERFGLSLPEIRTSAVSRQQQSQPLESKAHTDVSTATTVRTQLDPLVHHHPAQTSIGKQAAEQAAAAASTHGTSTSNNMNPRAMPSRPYQFLPANFAECMPPHISEIVRRKPELVQKIIESRKRRQHEQEKQQLGEEHFPLLLPKAVMPRQVNNNDDHAAVQHAFQNVEYDEHKDDEWDEGDGERTELIRKQPPHSSPSSAVTSSPSTLRRYRAIDNIN